MGTALLDSLPLLLEERGARSSLSNLNSSRSHKSVGSYSAASIRFSERSAVSGLGPKCVQCTLMGIRICANCCGKKTPLNTNRSSLTGIPEKRNVKADVHEESPEAQELLCCLREKSVDIEDIKELISIRKSVVNVRESSFGWSPILFAAHRGDAKLLSVLLDARANVNNKCHQGNSALHLAARRGDLNAATCLHSRGADIDMQNAQGWTPLTWSAIAGCPSIASLLLDAAADATVVDSGGRTACMWAARHGHTDILRSLLLMGPDLSMRDEDGFTIKDHAKSYAKARKSIAAVTIADDSDTFFGTTAEGSLDLQRLVMQHGAAGNSCQDGKGGEAQHCLEAPLHALHEAMLRSNELLDAARWNNWDKVDEALRAGACASTRDNIELRSPLSWAAIHDAPASAFTLVAAMADLEARDGLGWTALHHAVHAESAETVAVLHYLGADFAAKSEDGDSVQHLAALSDAGEMLQLLGPATSDWNIRNKAGQTPLQVSVTRGCLSAVGGLLALKADASVEDDRGMSVLSLAIEKGHTAVIRILFEPVEPLPRVWDEDILNKMLAKLPWVDSDVVDNDAQSCHGTSSSNASACSGSYASLNSFISARNNKLGTKLAGKLLQRKKHGMHPIQEVDSEAGSTQGTPRTERPKSAGSHTSLKSAALTQVSSQSRAASMAKSVHSQASVQSLAKSTRSQVSNQGLARSAISHVSLRSTLSVPHSRASGLTGASGLSRRSLGGRSRASAGGRSKVGRINYSGPPTIYSMAMTVLDKSPLSLMNAACKVSSSPELPPPLTCVTALAAADANGSTALALAARTRQTDVLRLLLELKAAPDTSDSEGNTVLMLAAKVGEKHMVARLLGARAGIDSQNTSGHQAVDLASTAEIREVLQAEMDRSAVEKHVRDLGKSCSLPKLTKARPRLFA